MLTKEERLRLAEQAIDSDDPNAFDKLEARLQEDDRQKAEAKRGRRKLSGKYIQNQCLRWLVKDGWMAIRHNSLVTRDNHLAAYKIENKMPVVEGTKDNVSNSAGYSDITAGKDGRHIYFEVKGHGDRQRDSQKRFQALCEQHGMEYYIISSLEEMKSCLNPN